MSVKVSIKIVLLTHIQLQFKHFNIYDSIRLYDKLRSIPVSQLVPQCRKPKKLNRTKGCIMCQNTYAFRSAENSKSFLDYRMVKLLANTARVN